MPKILNDEVLFCAHSLSFNEIKKLTLIFDLTGLVVKFKIHNSQSCVPSSEGCFISYGVAPRWLPALLAGCFVNFFLWPCCYKRKDIPLACSFLADGVFFVRALLSNKIKSTPPERGAPSTVGDRNHFKNPDYLTFLRFFCIMTSLLAFTSS